MKTDKFGSKKPVPDLLPAAADHERVATLQEVQSLIDSSRSDKFTSECQHFCSAHEPADQVVAFCTSKASWRQGMGMAGFSLRRNGVEIARVVTKMN